MNERYLEEFRETKQLRLNRPQLRFVVNKRHIKSSTNIWARATGKTYVIAQKIDDIVKEMPGSSWALQSSTFALILKYTLPGVLAALESMGYIRDVHYVLRKAPPKGWKLPFQAPAEFEHYITFYNAQRCVGFHLFSQDRKSSVRGTNVDGIIVDEALLIDEQRFFSETTKTNRGHLDVFGHIPYHHGIFMFTSMPYGQSGQWLIDKGNYLQDEYGFNHRLISNQLIELQLEFMKEKEVKYRLQMWKEIARKQAELRFLPSRKGHLYSEANTFENIENIGLGYIQDEYDNTPDLSLFMVEVLNKRIETISESFYAGLDRHVHGYKGSYDYGVIDNTPLDSVAGLKSRMDKDCVAKVPLELGLDFGGKINWCIVAQHFKSINRINFIKNFYVKTPDIIDDLANDFCDYYEGHAHKVSHIWPDGMGNDEVANHKLTYTQQFESILKKRGWTTIIKNKTKKNPEHHLKRLVWVNSLRATKDRINNKHHLSVYPTVMFNIINCKELLFAMENTATVDNGNNLIGKNKSSEKLLSLAHREKATDSTDAADQIFYGLFKHLASSRTGYLTPRYF
jgi:hypothetical protein